MHLIDTKLYTRLIQLWSVAKGLTYIPISPDWAFKRALEELEDYEPGDKQTKSHLESSRVYDRP